MELRTFMTNNKFSLHSFLAFKSKFAYGVLMLFLLFGSMVVFSALVLNNDSSWLLMYYSYWPLSIVTELIRRIPLIADNTAASAWCMCVGFIVGGSVWWFGLSKALHFLARPSGKAC